MIPNQNENYLTSIFFVITACCILLFGEVSAEVSLDARSIGLGGQLASSSYGASGLFNNPATVAFLRQSDFSYDFSQTALAFTSPIQIEGQRPFSLATVGIGLTDLLAYDRFFSASRKNPIGMQMWGDNQLMLTIARSVGTKVQIGANFGIRQHLYLKPDRSIARSLVYPYDIGLILRPNPKVSVGLVYHYLDFSSVYDNPNVKNEMLIDSQAPLRIGQSVDGSSNLQIDTFWSMSQPKDELQVHIRSGLDIRTNTDNDWQYRLGAEIGQYGLWLRSGFALQLLGTSITPQPRLSWRVGASIEQFDTALHYAYQYDDQDYRHYLSLNFAIGQFIHRNVITKTEKSTKKSEFRTLSTDRVAPQNDKKNNEPTQKEVMLTPTSSRTERIATEFQIPVEYLMALIKMESSFQPSAISKSGAVGLGQLMAPTARDLGLKVPEYHDPLSPTINPKVDERFDARRNLEASAKYLRQMLNRYEGNYALALAAYNAGPGRVKHDIPLIRETERYVGKVLNTYYQYKANPSLRNTDLNKLDQQLE